MPNKKVTELPVATSIDPTDVLLVVQGGVTKQVSQDTVAASLSTTYSTLAQLAANPDQLAVGTITRSTTGAATSFGVVWPDGSTGTFAGTESTSFPGAIDAYAVTKVRGGTTITFSQPALTRSPTGAVTNRPAMTVS